MYLKKQDFDLSKIDLSASFKIGGVALQVPIAQVQAQRQKPERIEPSLCFGNVQVPLKPLARLAHHLITEYPVATTLGVVLGIMLYRATRTSPRHIFSGELPATVTDGRQRDGEAQVGQG